MPLEQWLPVVTGMLSGAITGWITVQVRLTKIETQMEERAKTRELERRDQQNKESIMDQRWEDLRKKYHDLREAVSKYQFTVESVIKQFVEYITRK